MNFIAKILLNSLYGRFGMDDNFDNINVIHKDYYSDFENKFIDQITEKIEVDDYIIVFYRASTLVSLKRDKTISTPFVEENPGLPACPPPFTANGVRVDPRIRS